MTQILSDSQVKTLEAKELLIAPPYKQGEGLKRCLNVLNFEVCLIKL